MIQVIQRKKGTKQGRKIGVATQNVSKIRMCTSSDDTKTCMHLKTIFSHQLLSEAFKSSFIPRGVLDLLFLLISFSSIVTPYINMFEVSIDEKRKSRGTGDLTLFLNQCKQTNQIVETTMAYLFVYIYISIQIYIYIGVAYILYIYMYIYIYGIK